MQRNRWIGLGLVLLSVAALAGCLLVVVGLIRWLPTLLPTQIAPTRALLVQMQSIDEWVTVKYLVEKVVKLEAEPSILGRDRVVLLTHAVVKAGVDLKSMRAEDIQVSGKKVVVRLPSARITDCYLDDHRTEVWEHNTAFWRPLDKDLEQNARRQAVEEIRRAAAEQGIQKEAMERARSQLKWLLQNLGYTEVSVEVR